MITAEFCIYTLFFYHIIVGFTHMAVNFKNPRGLLRGMPFTETTLYWAFGFTTILYLIDIYVGLKFIAQINWEAVFNSTVII